MESILRTAPVHLRRGLIVVFAMSHASPGAQVGLQTLGMRCGDVRDAVIPHYIIEKGRGGKIQVVRPDAPRQLNARGTQTSITSRSSIRNFDGVRLLN